MNRKFFMTLCLALFAFVAIAQDYRITCVADSAFEGKVAYLVDDFSGDSIASSVVADGAFSFEGDVDDAAILQVVLNRIKGKVATVLVEKGTKALVDFTVRPVTVVDNGGVNDRVNAIRKSSKECESEVNAQAKQMRDEGAEAEKLDAFLSAGRERLNGIYRAAINDNKDNIVGAYMLGAVARGLYSTLAGLDSAISEVKYAKKVKQVMNLRAARYQGEITKPGCKFVDFGGFDIDGTAVMLSDYVGKGKYVLVDFWASWCGPCKNEMPSFIAMNKKYAGDKIVILGVNISDVEEKFKEAVKNLGIDYPQIFVPKKGEYNAAMLYNVETIPHTILFDPDGTIVVRQLLGEELEKTIEQYIK